MCDCPLCTRNKRFTEIIEKLSPEEKKFMEEFLTYTMCVESDNDVNEMKLAGTWPGNRDQMKPARTWLDNSVTQKTND